MRKMGQKSIAANYHQQTKYFESKMAEQQVPLDWAAQPALFKDYHSETKVDLTPYLPLRNNPFTGKPIVPMTDMPEGYPFTLSALSLLLYFTNGVTGILQYPSGESLSMRAAPTAGGLYPVEIYVAVRNSSVLRDGIHNFQVNNHSLVLAWEGDFWPEFERYCLGHDVIAHSNIIIITTAVFQRSAWRYNERAYRRILLDTGHVLGNLIAYAPEEGFFPYPIGDFADDAMNRLLFLDEETEGVMSVVALPQIPVNTKIRAGNFPQLQVATDQDLGDEDASDPLFLQLHRGTAIKMKKNLEGSVNPPLHEYAILEKKYALNTSVSLLETPIDWQTELGQTILSRRSTRAYTGEAFSKTDLSSLLEYAYAAPRFPSPLLFSPALIETYLVIQNVTDVDEGIYYYAPASQELRLIAPGDFKSQTWRFCLGQELARDAAVLVIHTAHLEDAVAQHGDRAYRSLHMDAGHIGQRLNLAAIHLKLGVSGIGGFYDDEVNALLGLSLANIVLYITTLGQVHALHKS